MKRLNKKRPLISVVIPAYNEEKHLPKTLEFLDRQTLDRSLYEVIVVDNGSSDKTSIIAKNYNARLVREKKKGIRFAREKGLKEAKGEIIASTDADTILPPFWLKRIWHHFQVDLGLAAVFGSIRLVREDGRPYLPQGIYKVLDLFYSLSCRLKRPFFTGFNYAIARKPFLKAGGYHSILGDIDDLPIGLIIPPFGKVVFDPKLIAYSSARRIEHEGLVKTVLIAVADYLQMAWFKKPIFRRKEDYR